MEITTGSKAGDGGSGLGSRRVPAGRPVAQRCGSRHITDQDIDNNNDNNNNEHQGHNEEDHHEDGELGSEEIVSAVVGTGEVHGVQSHSSPGVVRGLCKSLKIRQRLLCRVSRESC